jgi:hypothetical protein
MDKLTLTNLKHITVSCVVFYSIQQNLIDLEDLEDLEFEYLHMTVTSKVGTSDTCQKSEIKVDTAASKYNFFAHLRSPFSHCKFEYLQIIYSNAKGCGICTRRCHTSRFDSC